MAGERALPDEFQRQQRQHASAAAFVAWATTHALETVARAEESGMGRGWKQSLAQHTPGPSAGARMPGVRRAFVRRTRILSRARAAVVRCGEGQLLPGLPSVPCGAAAEASSRRAGCYRFVKRHAPTCSLISARGYRSRNSPVNWASFLISPSTSSLCSSMPLVTALISPAAMRANVGRVMRNVSIGLTACRGSALA